MEICIIRSMKGQYGSNCIASWSEFAKNIGKIQVDQIFLKEKYGSIERTIWARLLVISFED